MELVKVSGTNVKLACKCARQFWVSTTKINNCPDCKEVWDGSLIKYFIIRLQSERGEDYQTIYVGKHTTAASCLFDVMKSATLPFYMASGISIQEISVHDMALLDPEKVNKSCEAYLASLKARV